MTTAPNAERVGNENEYSESKSLEVSTNELPEKKYFITVYINLVNRERLTEHRVWNPKSEARKQGEIRKGGGA